MARYRRKTATVDAWRLDGPVTSPRLSGKVVYVGCKGDWLVAYGGGRFVIEEENTFDREYERVEEKGIAVPHLHDVEAYMLAECKKPSLLALADLKPGAVYHPRGAPFHTDQLLGWRENGNSLHYCQQGARIDFDLRTLTVRVVAHHPLTPKQLLWIAATPEERNALEDSIRNKWLPRVKGERPPAKCALCVYHRREGMSCVGKRACKTCILTTAGEQCEDPGSPWKRWYDLAGRYDNDSWRAASDEEHERTRDMALSLAAYLPNIHPLRIEVEATPVEWPGGE